MIHFAIVQEVDIPKEIEADMLLKAVKKWATRGDVTINEIQQFADKVADVAEDELFKG